MMSSNDDGDESDVAHARQGGSDKLVPSAGSFRWRGHGHSSRNDVAGLRCISEESASTERSGGSSAHAGTRSGIDGEQRELSADILSSSGDVIGTVTVVVNKVQPAAAVADRNSRSVAEETLPGSAGEELGAATEVRVCAETFCHLFRVSAAECRALEEYFRLTRQPVAERMSWT
jgi:hypothetical protein